MIFKNSCADCAAIKRSPPLSIRNGQRLKWPSKFAAYEKAKAGVKKTWPKVGCSQQAISAVEHAGYKSHSLPLLRRIAQVLDADVVVALVPRKAA
jgi:transcriptional regulator with XRE-family HTH domain